MDAEAWGVLGVMGLVWLVLVARASFEAWIWFADPIEAHVAERRSTERSYDYGRQVVREVLAEGVLDTEPFSVWTRVRQWPEESLRVRARRFRGKARIRATRLEGVIFGLVALALTPMFGFVVNGELGDETPAQFEFDRPFDSFAAVNPGQLPPEGAWRYAIQDTLLEMPGVTAVWFVDQQEAYIELLRMHRNDPMEYERVASDGVGAALPNIRLRTEFASRAEADAVRDYLESLPGVLSAYVEGDRP